MVVIPAIDLIEGSLVRLSEGDYSTKKSYGITPLDAAKRIEDAGLSHLHLVDLDGAKGTGRNLDVLERIAGATSLEIDFGGGIRSEADARSAFSAGAGLVNIGSLSARDPEEVHRLSRIWPGRIILSADCRDGLIAVSGWQEGTSLEVIPFIKRFAENGLVRAVVTDISKDGMLKGPSAELYKRIISQIPSVELVASGGVSSAEDLRTLKAIGCFGAIVGKAYYEGHITLQDMKEAEC